MDALTHLNEHIDMERLLAHYKFDEVREEGSYIRSCCKIHDGSNPSAFVVNTQNKLWYCHTGGCGGGDAYTLVQRMEEVSFKEAVEIVARIFNVDIAEMEIMERNTHQMNEMKRWIKAVQSRRGKSYHPYEINVLQKSVRRFRDFDEDTLHHFGLTFVEEVEAQKHNGETYTLRNRLVFPVYQNGVQIGASLRRTKSTDFPKWSHQPVKLKTSDILYNYDATHGENVIVVVEGMPDTWAFYEIGIVAVATFGAHLTDEQRRLLMRTGADIVLAYDGDEAGREATKKAYSVLYKTTNTKTMRFEPGEDPASISREELRKRYGERT